MVGPTHTFDLLTLTTNPLLRGAPPVNFFVNSPCATWRAESRRLWVLREPVCREEETPLFRHQVRAKNSLCANLDPVPLLRELALVRPLLAVRVRRSLVERVLRPGAVLELCRVLEPDRQWSRLRDTTHVFQWLLDLPRVK